VSRLSLRYGINVNMFLLNQSCSNPPFVRSRLTGGAVIDKVVFNETSALFTYGKYINQGVNTCINGDCSVSVETNVITGCALSMSVSTTDYDAPNSGGSANVRHLFEPLVAYSNGTTNGTATSLSSGSSSSTNSAQVTTTAGVKTGLSPARAVSLCGCSRCCFVINVSGLGQGNVRISQETRENTYVNDRSKSITPQPHAW
jgi:5'-nucleotidase